MNTNSAEHSPQNTPSIPPSLEDDEFVKRAESLFKFARTHSDRLRVLYITNPDHFQDELDTVVDEISDQDTEYIETFTELKNERKHGGERPDLVKRLNELRSKFKKIIISETGLPDEARFTEIEHAKEKVTQALLDKHNGEPVDDPTEALSLLGIITEGEEGKTMYSFPYDYMPNSVIEKWNTYLATVCEHVQAQADLIKTQDQKSVVQADDTRTYAHNSVTDDVHVILGLEGKNGWSRGKTRHLLANIRDAEFPRYEDALSEDARALVRSMSKEIDIAKILSS